MSGENLSQGGDEALGRRISSGEVKGFFGHFHSAERRHMLVDHYQAHREFRKLQAQLAIVFRFPLPMVAAVASLGSVSVGPGGADAGPLSALLPSGSHCVRHCARLPDRGQPKISVDSELLLATVYAARLPPEPAEAVWRLP